MRLPGSQRSFKLGLAV